LLTFYPSDAEHIPGGIRMVSYNLVQQLWRLPDLDLHVVHCHSDISADRLVRDDGVTLHYLATPRWRILPNLMTTVRRLQKTLHHLQPDVVHAHAGHFAYAAVRAGYPTLYTIHGDLRRERRIYTGSLYDRLRYGLLAYYEERALPRVQHLVAISPYVRQAYDDVEGPAWTRIDNPVPDDFFAIDGPSEPNRILYAGSITEIKDLLTLLRAVRRVRRQMDVRLCIAGRSTSADYAARVRAFVAEHDLGNVVEFAGLLGREAIKREYGRCAVVALASVQENAPMAVIEAMAAGRAVVATAVGGVPDLVREGETGFTVEVGDDAAMAERLMELLSDGDLRQTMGARARAVARDRFGAERIARAYHALYQQVHTQGRRSA
jgi:glycosyltransferase involved in cell wall biosynthesis